MLPRRAYCLVLFAVTTITETTNETNDCHVQFYPHERPMTARKPRNSHSGRRKSHVGQSVAMDRWNRKILIDAFEDHGFTSEQTQWQIDECPKANSRERA